eukprot:scaffold163388_cov20-Tisochrysis_lutea.AAC.1
MDRQEYARQMIYKGRQDKLKALFERAGGKALQANLEEKAKKDEADMIRAQALFEAQEKEKERLRKMRQEDMDRERKATITRQFEAVDVSRNGAQRKHQPALELQALWKPDLWLRERFQEKGDRCKNPWLRRVCKDLSCAAEDALCKQSRGLVVWKSINFVDGLYYPHTHQHSPYMNSYAVLQLAEKEAAMQAQAQELRQLKEKIDAEQAADNEAAKAAKAAQRERQAKEREAMKQAVMEENMRWVLLQDLLMSFQDKTRQDM